MKIDGSTKIVGVFGYPIKHTASPVMHNAAFEALHLNWVYLPFEVNPQNLAQAVRGLIPLGIQGVNLTIPHKREVLPFLDKLSEEAEFVGAVNTIVIEGGVLVGYDTDGKGIVNALKEEDVPVKDASILILGAGGAAWGVTRELFKEGARKVKVANRTISRAENLKKRVKKYLPHAKIEILPLQSSSLKEALREADLLINATSVGMHASDPLLVDSKWLREIKAVYDMIYNPTDTLLLRTAREKGIKAMNGLGMLLHQGAVSFRLWTGVEPPLEVMRKALNRWIDSKISNC